MPRQQPKAGPGRTPTLHVPPQLLRANRKGKAGRSNRHCDPEGVPEVQVPGDRRGPHDRLQDNVPLSRDLEPSGP